MNQSAHDTQAKRRKEKSNERIQEQWIWCAKLDTTAICSLGNQIQWRQDGSETLGWCGIDSESVGMKNLLPELNRRR